jgi:hypothetical protein
MPSTQAVTAGHALVFLITAGLLMLAGALEPRVPVLQRARVNFVALGLLVVVLLLAINQYKTAFDSYNLIP